MDIDDKLASGGNAGSRSSPAKWNAGGTGCGELILELKIRLAKLAPGALLELETTDPGAVEDIPSWCRLTGHRLVSANHPTYIIQRKEK